MNQTKLRSSINDAVYEDPEVVTGYVRRNSKYSKQEANIKRFLQHVDRNKILDLGCGPGQDSYVFASLGKKVTGLDFSNEMIRTAKKLLQVQNQPKFVQGDMRQLKNYFQENEFDGIWANASLLHIHVSELPLVFEGMKYVLQPDGVIAMSLKVGNETTVVETDKYGKKIQREFVFWQEEDFSALLKKHGFEIIEQYTQLSGTPPKQTEWLYYYVKVKTQ